MIYQSYLKYDQHSLHESKFIKFLEIGQWEQQMGLCADFMHSLQILKEFGRYFASYLLQQASKNRSLMNEKVKLKALTS